MTQEPDSKASQILARFPGPVTLYPSRKKWLLLLLAGLAFTLAGIWMVATAAPEGWFVLIFFGSGAIVSIVMLLPGASSLVLERDGFAITSLFRSHYARWQDVSVFAPMAIPFAPQKMVSFDDASASTKFVAKLSTGIAGHNSALPDTYGMSADELARLMTQWRDHART